MVAFGLAASAAFGQSTLAPLVGAGADPVPPWHVAGLPQQTKPYTRFSVVDLDGHRALRIEADASYGNLVHLLDPIASPARLRWQWRVDRPLAHTDLRQKSGDDSEVKVCVFFDEPMDRLSFVERQFLRYARSRTTEPVPSATVCYVWDPELAAGTTVDNAFTRRLRYIVLETGSARLGQWVAEHRDLAADFMRVFGGESPAVPPIVGIAIGADADNTRGHSLAYVSELTLDR